MKINRLMLGITLIGLLAGCGSKEEVKEVNQVKVKEEVKESVKEVVKEVKKVENTENVQNFDQLIKHFESNGTVVTERTVQMFQMVGAVNGESMKLDGVYVEIFEYENESKVSQGVEYMKSFDGTCITNGKFLLYTDGIVTNQLQLFEGINK